MESLQHCENDALLVDDLLDFSCGDIGGLCEEGEDCVVTLCGQESENSCFQGSSVRYCVEGSVVRTSEEPSSEAGELLYAQPDELADLEWFSSFVEESYKGEDQSIPLVSSEQWFSKSSSRRVKEEEEEEVGVDIAAEEERSCSWRRSTSWLRVSNNGAFSHILDMGTSPLIESTNATCSSTKSGSNKWDKRSRSRRRSGGRVWTLVPLSQRTHKRPRAVLTHQEQEEEEDVYSQASSLEYEPYYGAEQEQRKKACGRGGGGAWSIEGRRCSHCQVQKTPQWRAGPLGPKTLCNACGVRYKSGRLLPEYRPAASPTFITELHSNSHKKVLEMRTCKSRVAQKRDQEEFSTCSQESISTLHH